MRHFYALIAVMAAFFSVALNAHAADDSDASNIKVLWNRVIVDESGTTPRITVTARLQLVSGTTFSAKVFPIIHSMTRAIDYGMGTPQQVTLPDNGSDTTPMITWTIDAEPSLTTEKSATLGCGMYFENDFGKDINIDFIEIKRSGTTGVSDIVAEGSADSTETELYTLGGVSVGSDLQTLPQGIYIMRCGNTYSKVIRR